MHKKTSVSQRRLKQKRMKKNILLLCSKLFLLEELLDLIGQDDVFLEGIGIGLGRANHTDNLGIALTSGGFQGCNNFLCHSSLSPIYLISL